MNYVAGGCLCRAIRYEAVPRADTAYYCHCRDCQIGSASAFHVGVFVDEDKFRIANGTPQAYARRADSGRMLSRMFCPTCGTPVYWTGEGFVGVVVISVSSLDDPEAFAPRDEGWTARALTWSRIRDDIRSFSGRPDR